jgi:heme-degrading monooxygenase HmoA
VAVFIAMNRFQVKKDRGEDFEIVWKERETHLSEVPGFVEFHLLRGPEHDDYMLYASHTVWRSKRAFEDWTQSEAFRKAHEGAGGHRDIYLGPPQFEGFEVIQTVK